MWKIVVAAYALMVLAGCATPGESPPGDVVIIDTTTPAFTVLFSVPPEQLDQVKTKVQKEARVEFVPWHTFIGATNQYVSSRIIKNEYPGSGAVEGLVELLKKYPQTPFAITWNGGIALTGNDYRHARSTYNKYTADPAEYERTRVRDPRGDPVNPAGHLGPLLGR